MREGQTVKITKTGEEGLVLGTDKTDTGNLVVVALDRDGQGMVMSFPEDELEE